MHAVFSKKNLPKTFFAPDSGIAIPLAHPSGKCWIHHYFVHSFHFVNILLPPANDAVRRYCFQSCLSAILSKRDPHMTIIHDSIDHHKVILTLVLAPPLNNQRPPVAPVIALNPLGARTKGRHRQPLRTVVVNLPGNKCIISRGDQPSSRSRAAH